MKLNGLIILMMCAFGLSTLADVLYIGDSHSYVKSLAPEADKRRFGNVLIDGLRAQGHKVSYYAACGSAPGGWARGSKTTCGYSELTDSGFLSPVESKFPAISDIYVPARHTLLIVNLGDNMFSWKKNLGKTQATFSLEAFKSDIGSLLEKISDVKPANCVWVGPTYHIEGATYRKSNAAVDELYTALTTALNNKCRLIDSRALVVPKEPNDGLHHVGADSRAWAQGVLLKLTETSGQ